MIKASFNFAIRCVCLVVILSLIFLTLLSLISLIPNQFIDNNVKASLKTIDQEGNYSELFSFGPSATLDNFTDRLMIEKMILKEGINPIKAITSDYARYWHGYTIILRPLLLVGNYKAIRFLNMILFYILFFLTSMMIKKKIGILYSLAFIVSIIMAFSFIVPMSLQFSSVYYVSFFFMVMLMAFFHNTNFQNKLPYMFLITGAIVNFFDFLTAPLLTLGIPLILIVILFSKYSLITFREMTKKMVLCSVCWGFGYGGAWICKWGISSLITGNNVFQNALNSGKFRMQGSDHYPLDRMDTLKTNFLQFFNSTSVKIIIIMALILLIIVILNFNLSMLKYTPFFIAIALLPYCWILLMSNHSQIHYWFVYRIQIISCFAFLSLFINLIDIQKIKNNKNNILMRINFYANRLF